MRLGHEKGKVRKTDECISELLRMRTLVNGVEMPFAGVLVFHILRLEKRLEMMQLMDWLFNGILLT